MKPTAKRKKGRPLKKVVSFAGRARFMRGCPTCEWLRDEYECVMPYHEPAKSCPTYQPHCTCEECW